MTAPKRPVGRPRIHPPRTTPIGTHGGRREGAGKRPEIDGGVKISIRLPGLVDARYRDAAARNGTTASALMRAVLEREAPPS